MWLSVVVNSATNSSATSLYEVVPFLCTFSQTFIEKWRKPLPFFSPFLFRFLNICIINILRFKLGNIWCLFFKYRHTVVKNPSLPFSSASYPFPTFSLTFFSLQFTIFTNNFSILMLKHNINFFLPTLLAPIESQKSQNSLDSKKFLKVI